MITKELPEDASRIALTVSYEEPFWVGVIEREKEGEKQVARKTFEVEPTPTDLYRWIQSRFPQSLHFIPFIEKSPG